MIVVGGDRAVTPPPLYAARAGDTIGRLKTVRRWVMALTEQIITIPALRTDRWLLFGGEDAKAGGVALAQREYAEAPHGSDGGLARGDQRGGSSGETVVLATGAEPRTLGVAESRNCGPGRSLLLRRLRMMFYKAKRGRGGRW